MLRSLRFQLPALFLAAIVLAVAVASAIAVGLFQDHAREQSLAELRREAIGLTGLYAEQALQTNEENREPPLFAEKNLERATGDQLFYVGAQPFAESEVLEPLPVDVVDWQSGKVTTFEFERPGTGRTFIGVAAPLRIERQIFGALVVAKPKSELRARWLTLIQRLALALAGGVLVATALAWFLSRRITQPMLALSRAADEVASGQYAVDIPDVPGGSEVGDLAERFRQMAARLGQTDERERNFLMSVSHELRTPLTAIRGHVEALREGLVEDPDLRAESLDVIAAEAGRLERLVGDVLDLAKLDADRFTVHHEEVDMERLCDQAYAAFGEEARRRSIDYRQEMEDRPVIVSDGDRVLQIISNLLSNAFRWTPDGGKIELSLGAENGAVRVAVGDTGPGISPEDRERIFRPFWSRDASGSGLGLAIAHELAQALGGRIELETEAGRGSRFELVLPTAPKSSS